jgi:hypothetical protein
MLARLIAQAIPMHFRNFTSRLLPVRHKPKAPVESFHARAPSAL